MPKLQTSLEASQERLRDLKQFQLNEQRSAKPSPLYLSDLAKTIAQVERNITYYKGEYEIVGK